MKTVHEVESSSDQEKSKAHRLAVANLLIFPYHLYPEISNKKIIKLRIVFVVDIKKGRGECEIMQEYIY